MADEIVDAHHHLWRLERTPWLAGPPVQRIFGDYRELRRDYSAREFAAEAGRAGVTKSVYVQVNVAPGDEVEEVAWASGAGRTEGLVQGIVSFADLGAPDVGDVLDRELAVGPVRGVRQQLHWHEREDWRFAPTPDRMLDPTWQRGLGEVIARDLLFEIQVFVAQFPQTLQLVDLFPHATFVLLHAGMPTDRTPSGWSEWRQGLEQFAKRDNVYVKLSGLGTFVRRCTVNDWQPVIEQCIERFGADRCMFGSNFPIEKLWTTYGQLVDVFVSSLGGLSSTERRHVLHDVATRLYRLA